MIPEIPQSRIGVLCFDSFLHDNFSCQAITTYILNLGRIYSLQQGLTLDKKSKEAIAVLTTLMNWLEVAKKELIGLEVRNMSLISSTLFLQDLI